MKKLITALCIIFLFVGVSFAGTTATSGVTAGTIISRAEVYLNSTSDPFFSNAQYLQWIDEAVRETITRTGCTETTPITVTLSANTTTYSLGQSFLKVIAVQHDNGDTTASDQIKTLDRSNPNDIGHDDSIGRPSIYAIWNNKIEVWPIPRTAEAATSLYVYTVPLPTGVSTTSSAIETPAYFDIAILYYVVAQGNYRNHMLAEGDKFLALWEKRLGEYNALMVQRKPVE